MGFNILIVDDERMSRSYIRNLVEEFLPGSEIYEARNAAIARRIVTEGNIDILFLDVEMPEMSGIDLAASLPERSFELVMITAHSHYAIDALRTGACDYILKPIGKKDFKEMLERLIQVINRKKKQVISATAGTEAEDAYPTQKVAIHQQSGIKFIPVTDIEYMRAWNTYTAIHHASGVVTMVSKAINRFEDTLDPKWFFRVHKSFIVNLHHCLEYSSVRGNKIIMNSGTKLPVSRHRLKHFIAFFKNKDDVVVP